MYLARVVANIVSTQKSQKLIGKKLLIVQPIDAESNEYGKEILALDGVGAGVGDIVVALCEGASARLIAGTKSNAPCEVVVAGIIDYVDSSYGHLDSEGILTKNK